jgi:hypothetical protein
LIDNSTLRLERRHSRKLKEATAGKPEAYRRVLRQSRIELDSFSGN